MANTQGRTRSKLSFKNILLSTYLFPSFDNCILGTNRLTRRLVFLIWHQIQGLFDLGLRVCVCVWGGGGGGGG